MTLSDALGILSREGSVPRSLWPPDEDPHKFGLTENDGDIVPAGTFEPLVPDRIRPYLSGRASGWLKRLEVHTLIGSTNTALMQRTARESVDGVVCLAEVQVEGRGRRGRSWVSPFGANLAVSLGIGLSRPPARLSGVSLVVGLAVMDALERLNMSGLALKWPNDILLDGNKLGGILIEMTQVRGTELVIGVGLNVALSERLKAGLPEGIADLSRVSPRPSRNELAGRLVSAVVDFVAGFDELGFEPFKAAFDARHYYHDKACRILQGDRTVWGTVSGVTGDGELMVNTSEGSRTFNAGEVSLRGET